jgi:hypothetical protein
MPIAYPRRVAGLLLRFAIWIAPHDTLDWGYGMLSELDHVQGDWAALIWAMGGAGVLAKHTLLSVILPGSNRHTVSSAGELFAKESSMRKTTLAIIGVCAVASFLFFLAPVFGRRSKFPSFSGMTSSTSTKCWTTKRQILDWKRLRRRPNKIMMRRGWPSSPCGMGTTPRARGSQRNPFVSTCAWRIVFSPSAWHATLLHSVLELARIELVVADSKGIGAG